MKAKGLDDTGYANLATEDWKAFDIKVKKLAREEYFTCLFVSSGRRMKDGMAN